MALSTTQSSFQAYGSRDDLLIIPSPGQLWQSRKTTALYVISSPLPPNTETIRFQITSHDQGWASDPSRGNWTWFAVSILRQLTENVESPIHFENTEYIKSQPEDFGAQFQDSGYYFENIITGDGEAISIPLVVNQLGQEWQHHSITWSRLGGNDGSRFISLLEEGDCLVIWACAEFPGWTNFVREASIFVSSASSTESPTREYNRQESAISESLNLEPPLNDPAMLHLQHLLSLFDQRIHNKASFRLERLLREGDAPDYIFASYINSGDMSDLDKRLLEIDEVLSSIPIDHHARSSLLYSTGLGFGHKYEETSQSEDLDKSVHFSQLASLLDPSVPAPHSLFAQVLLKRYKRYRHENDLNKCISSSEKAIACIPSGYSGITDNLAVKVQALIERYELKRKTEDFNEIRTILDEIFRDYKFLVEHTPPYLWAYFSPQEGYSDNENDNKAEDDKWIRIAEQALASTSNNEKSRSIFSFKSAIVLRRRYARTNDMDDLERSILRMKEAVALFDFQPEDWPPMLLSYLADSLLERYKRKTEIIDINGAEEHINKAITLFQNGTNTPWRVFGYYVLSQVSIARFELTKSVTEVKAAIEMFDNLDRESLGHTSASSQHLFLSGFGNLHEAMYSATGRVEHFEIAMEKINHALTVVPKHDANRGTVLKRRAALLYHQHLVKKDMRLGASSFEAMWESVQSPDQSPLDRIVIARSAITVLWLHEACGEEAAQIVSYILPLVPYACGRDLERQDQIHTAKLLSATAGLAIFVFLRNNMIESALRSLELTRGLIINSLLDDQSDLSNLQQSHPELAKTYNTLRLQTLQSAELSDKTIDDSSRNKRREAYKELEDCENQIRQQPGFESFQQQMSLEDFLHVAEEGPLVIVNCIPFGCDAVLITKSGIHTIPLSEMTTRAPPEFQERLTRSGDIDLATPRDLQSDEPPLDQSMELLSWLWTTCVEPILEVLSSKGALSTSDEKSRVWWIGTGSASVLPFHAAGDYIDGILVPGRSCLDKVMSSYTPTIKVLANARARAAQRTCVEKSNSSKDSLLLVTMPTTPGHSDLLGARRESEAIAKTAGQTLTVQEMEQPSAKDVLGRLSDHSGMVHFACHGYSDPSDPSLSHLLLQRQGEQGLEADKLSVATLLNTRFEGQAWIAYLSACSTANNKHVALADESLHITSGFLIAGFAHVIGSLWSADDDVCVCMATHFYSSLLANQANKDINRAVANAVHSAQLHTRREYADNPSMWALYIHVGA